MRSTRMARWLVLVLLLATTTNVKAQVGTTTCICAPSNYRMTFDFGQTCENTALRGDGVVTSDCAIAPFQDDSVTDLVPVSVGSVDILELDQNLVLLAQSSKFGTYQNGDSFDYEAVSSIPSSVNATSYPRALQVSVIGNNAAGETLFFAGLMVFVTDCSVYPNLVEGASIGWIQFTSLSDPYAEVCPLAEASLPVAADVSSSSSSSKKAPTMAPRSSKAPAARTPSHAPVTRYHSDDNDDDDDDDDAGDCESGKGKKKKGKSSGKGKSGKGKKKGKGHNVFDHECYEKTSDKKKHSSGKGKKGKGSESSFTYDDLLDILHKHPIPPTRGPVEAPSTLHPTISSVRIDTSSSDLSSADVAGSSDYSSADQKIGFVDPRPFWGSASYYVVLSCSVILALIGACLMCYRPRWSIVDEEEANRQRRSILKHDDETWMTE